MRRKQFYADLAERTLWTFVQAFAASLLVLGTLDRDVLYTALLAGVFAVAKCLLAVRIGDGGTASTLPS